VTTLTLDTDLVTALGATNAAALDKHFGMTKVRDLLYHVPRRYGERGEPAEASPCDVLEKDALDRILFAEGENLPQSRLDQAHPSMVA